MSDTDLNDDYTDAWLVDATRDIDEPAADVRRLISSITGNLGRVRRPGRPIAAADDPRILFNDRVLKQLIATRIRTSLGALVVHVALDGDDRDIDDVRIGLIAHYLDELPAASDDIRHIVDEILGSLLGLGPESLPPIDVRWRDVFDS